MDIDIPDDIVIALKAYIKKEEKHQSVEEYIVYLLQQVVDRIEKTPAKFSKEEEEKVMKRLKALGYLD